MIAPLVTVLALLAAMCWALRARRLAKLVHQLGTEIDRAHLAYAALSVDRGSAGTWRRRAEVALRVATVVDHRLVASACAAVARHGARELERHRQTAVERLSRIPEREWTVEAFEAGAQSDSADYVDGWNDARSAAIDSAAPLAGEAP